MLIYLCCLDWVEKCPIADEVAFLSIPCDGFDGEDSRFIGRRYLKFSSEQYSWAAFRGLITALDTTTWQTLLSLFSS